jgi:hypothetical protein
MNEIFNNIFEMKSTKALLTAGATGGPRAGGPRGPKTGKGSG